MSKRFSVTNRTKSSHRFLSWNIPQNWTDEQQNDHLANWTNERAGNEFACHFYSAHINDMTQILVMNNVDIILCFSEPIDYY